MDNIKFNITKVERFPYKGYGLKNYHFFNKIPNNKLDKLPNEVIDKVKNLNNNDFEYSLLVEHDNKIYRVHKKYNIEDYKDFNLNDYIFEITSSKNEEFKQVYDNFQKDIDKIETLIGSIVSLKDLPITDVWRDFTKPTYRLEGSTIILSMHDNGPNMGSAGGPTTIHIADIAKIYFTGENGKDIEKCCKACGTIFYKTI